MSGDLIFRLMSEHGPWVMLVFYLLYRDSQKDAATREVLNRNTALLTEMTTLIRERMPHSFGSYR